MYIARIHEGQRQGGRGRAKGQGEVLVGLRALQFLLPNETTKKCIQQ